jgi:DNA-binding transcriptional LysR family regulator
MELSWLEDFMVLAGSGNFSRAAEQRHLTQPAFSRRIRALEEWAGVTLFDRSAQPIGLTEAGRRFHPLAAALIQDLARARDEARAVGAAAQTVLRFAATHVLSLIFFSSWLSRWEEQGALWTVHLSSDSLQGCEVLMLDGKADFLLCHHHAAAPNRLGEDGFDFVRLAGDTLLPCATSALAGEARAPFLLYSASSGLGRIFRAALGGLAEEIARKSAFTSDLAALLKAMCLEGRGIAWLPRSLIESELAAGRLAVIGDEGWRIPLEIRLYRNRRSHSLAADGFWQAITTA